MQLRAQNLLHRISLQADTARCVRTVTTGFNSSSDNRILEGDSQRTPALGSPWPSCWCRGPASESSTPRRVSHSGGGRNSNKTSSHVSQHSCCHAWKKKSLAGRVKGCGINLESLSFSYSLFFLQGGDLPPPSNTPTPPCPGTLSLDALTVLSCLL